MGLIPVSIGLTPQNADHLIVLEERQVKHDFSQQLHSFFAQGLPIVLIRGLAPPLQIVADLSQAIERSGDTGTGGVGINGPIPIKIIQFRDEKKISVTTVGSKREKEKALPDVEGSIGELGL